jgi:dual specificity phosphatase 12
MDQIPQAGKLFIGGLRALDVPDRLKNASITHILSVLEYDHCEWEEFDKYVRLLIQSEDHPRENLLQHFERTNTFIKDGLRGDGAVIVHCAMGVSRSATVVCAYLMKTQSLSPEEALDMIRKSRPPCRPNEGFLAQLGVYHRMLNATSDEDADQIYSDWFTKALGASKI